MINFIADQPWSRITKLARHGRPNCVAVPYLHGDADRLLPLQRGDVLKVNIMSCQVSPASLRQYLKKGVSVYTTPDLHAKVFVLGKTVVVGSTNISATSESRSQEAVIETTNPRVLVSAQKFIDSLESYPVTRSWLRTCARIYKKPSFAGGSGSRAFQDPELWCRRVMKLVDRRAVTHDGRNRYYISLNADGVARAFLKVDQNLEGQAVILLSLHPGDTQSQAKAFYAKADEDKIVHLKNKGWELFPNLHFGFAIAGMCWITATPMPTKQYIRFWRASGLPIKTVPRDKSGFRLFFRNLLQLKLILATDIPELEKNFTKAKRNSLQIRPGLTLQFAWPHTGELPKPEKFAAQVRLRINEALAACDQPILQKPHGGRKQGG